MGITKTDFMRGMQCRKMPWLDRHKRYLQVIPPEIQAKLDAGNEFGDRAMGMFGPYEEMTAYLEKYLPKHIPDKEAMIRNTQDALRRGVEVICEAAFSNYNNYCAVDILKKTAAGYDIYEVKNAPEVHEQFIRDAGFQYYILKRCGLRIGGIWIVIHGPEEENPFLPVEVTGQAKGYYVTVLYIWLNKPEIAIERVDKRVRAGGHDIPEETIRRRYQMGLNYLFHEYMQTCDKWILADNSEPPFEVIAEGSKKGLIIRDMEKYNRIRSLVTDQITPSTPLENVAEFIAKEISKVPLAHDGVPYQSDQQKNDQP